MGKSDMIEAVPGVESETGPQTNSAKTTTSYNQVPHWM